MENYYIKNINFSFHHPGTKPGWFVSLCSSSTHPILRACFLLCCFLRTTFPFILHHASSSQICSTESFSSTLVSHWTKVFSFLHTLKNGWFIGFLSLSQVAAVLSRPPCTRLQNTHSQVLCSAQTVPIVININANVCFIHHRMLFMSSVPISLPWCGTRCKA